MRAHSETVLRAFYDFHQAAGTGPVVNPFPLHRSRRGGRANAHHDPMGVCLSSKLTGIGFLLYYCACSPRRLRCVMGAVCRG